MNQQENAINERILARQGYARQERNQKMWLCLDIRESARVASVALAMGERATAARALH
jgi:hypothetical protein